MISKSDIEKFLSSTKESFHLSDDGSSVVARYDKKTKDGVVTICFTVSDLANIRALASIFIDRFSSKSSAVKKDGN